MALSIPQILRQFKADVSKALAPETIVKICDYIHENAPREHPIHTELGKRSLG